MRLIVYLIVVIPLITCDEVLSQQKSAENRAARSTTSTYPPSSVYPLYGYQEIRLVYNNNTYGYATEGRLEVYHNGRWGGVCSNNFGSNEARAVCRRLGLPDWNAHYYDYWQYGSGDGFIWIDRLSCGYNDYFNNCSFTGWGRHSCSSYSSVGVLCEQMSSLRNERTTTATISNASIIAIRLNNGRSTSSSYGRVEVLHNGRWGTVCDDYFDNRTATVICRMLGYYSDAEAYSNAYFGEGSGPILRDLQCIGYESDISQCSPHEWYTRGCSHSEDAGVSCYGRVSRPSWITTTLTYPPYPTNSPYPTNMPPPMVQIESQRNSGLYIFPYHLETTLTSPVPPTIALYGNQQIRLVYNNNTYGYATEGRLEVYHNGRWGGVCYRYFGSNEARAVCRQLGLPDWSAQYYDYGRYGSGDNFIWIDRLSCEYYDYFNNCSFTGWGRHSCLNYDSVGVYCDQMSTFMTENFTTTVPTNQLYNISSYGYQQIRLVYNNNTYGYATEGRLEVYHNGRWGGVCSNNFGSNEARAVCRQLGLPDWNAHYYDYWQYGSGDNFIWIDRLSCGYYDYFNNCSLTGWGRHSCSSYNSVGVLCEQMSSLSTEWTTTARSYTASITAIRLNNGRSTSSSYGRVEVFHNGRWGTVCDDYFDNRTATVICRMLGYHGDAEAYSNSYFGEGSGPILLDLQCIGYESDISQCSPHEWYTRGCSHSEDAGVSCYGRITRPSWMTTNAYPWTSAYTTTSTTTWRPRTSSTYRSSTPWISRTSSTYQPSTPVRLRGGSNGWNGRVEIFHNGQWGTICDDSFDVNDARVVCRMLGYTNYWNVRYYDSAYFGAGSGQIWLDDLGCQGYENDISYCSSGGWGHHNCGHNEDVGVSCYGDISTTTMSSTYRWYQETTASFTKEDGISIYCSTNSWNVQVYLPTLYQRYPGLITSDIYLGQDSCTGYVSGNYLNFDHSYSGCKTNVTTNAGDLLYKNELVYAVHDPTYHFITRGYKFRIQISCHMSTTETVTDNIKQAHGHAHSHTHKENITGHYTVNMAFYEDSNFRYQKNGYPLTANIGDNVYVKVFTDIRDYNIKMRLNDCYTRPTPSAPDNLRFFLIRNGCPMDPNTHIISQSTHETRFKFQDFEYSTDHDNLYIYCTSKFCAVNDYSYSCDQACHRTNKRIIKQNDNDTSIKTVEILSVLKQGKRNIKKRSVGEFLKTSTQHAMTSSYTIPAIFSVIVLACVAVAVVRRYKKSPKGQREDV